VTTHGRFEVNLNSTKNSKKLEKKCQLDTGFNLLVATSWIAAKWNLILAYFRNFFHYSCSSPRPLPTKIRFRTWDREEENKNQLSKCTQHISPPIRSDGVPSTWLTFNFHWRLIHTLGWSYDLNQAICYFPPASNFKSQTAIAILVRLYTLIIHLMLPEVRSINELRILTDMYTCLNRTLVNINC